MTGIQIEHLRKFIIKPTLLHLGLWTQAAENLLVGTALHESHAGHYLKQMKGPAVGIYQIEPATHQDVWQNYLRYHSTLGDKVKILQCNGGISVPEQLKGNLYYASAIARIIYLRVPAPLPPAHDISELAHYWKKYYNTAQGKGREEQFIQTYRSNHHAEST